MTFYNFQMSATHYSRPGELLGRFYLAECNLSVSAAASAMHMPRQRLNDIVRGKRGITADTALSLGKFFGNAPQFWLNLQTHYDLAEAQASAGNRLDLIEPFNPASIP